jgi:hypothetical protein
MKRRASAGAGRDPVGAWNDLADLGQPREDLGTRREHRVPVERAAQQHMAMRGDRGAPRRGVRIGGLRLVQRAQARGGDRLAGDFDMIGVQHGRAERQVRERISSWGLRSGRSSAASPPRKSAKAGSAGSRSGRSIRPRAELSMRAPMQKDMAASRGDVDTVGASGPWHRPSGPEGNSPKASTIR